MICCFTVRLIRVRFVRILAFPVAYALHPEYKNQQREGPFRIERGLRVVNCAHRTDMRYWHHWDSFG